MNKLIVVAAVLVLLSASVLANADVTPQQLAKWNRERFLAAGTKNYPSQPVHIQQYNRPDNNAMAKEQFWKPKAQMNTTLNVQDSHPGGYRRGHLFLSPYWKRGLDWVKGR